MKELKDYIVSIENFPKEGILFRDITTLIEDPEGLKSAVDSFRDLLSDLEFDVIVGPEARGFIFGVPVAYVMGKGFVPVRKPGKLPRETVSKTYDLEYGTETLEMHKSSIRPGARVVVVDDLLATGGTTRAIIELVEEMGGEVICFACLIELKGLNGREKLKGTEVRSLIAYEGA